MKYLLANFKTNKNWQELQVYFEKLSNFYESNSDLKNNKTIFFLNSLYTLITKIKYPMINFGNQSGSSWGNGAFTSSVSFEQLKDEGIGNVLLGHSEEYEYFKQTIPRVNKNVNKALSLGLNVYLCFGNQNEITSNNELINELMNQLDELLLNVEPINLSKVVLAYEPIYAIGTNNPMSVQQANIIIDHLKNELMNKYNHKFVILYGGSVNVNNIKDFLNANNIDGFLVGKESLDINKMEEIITLVYGK